MYSRSWLLPLITAALLASCASQGRLAIQPSLRPPFECGLSSVDVVRQVQADSDFRIAALAIGRFTFPDDYAAALKHATYVCESLDTLSLAEPAAFSVVYGPAYEWVARTDVVFVVRDTVVTLLNLVHDGRVVGGLDVMSWNKFMSASDQAADSRDDARSLSCLLRAVAVGEMDTASCYVHAPLEITLSDSVWLVLFADYKLALRTDGVILGQ